MSALKSSGFKTHPYDHPLSYYQEKYGWGRSTINNYRRANMPLDDPHELLRKILGLHGKKPPLAKLQKIVLGSPEMIRLPDPPPRKKAAPPVEPAPEEDEDPTDETLDPAGYNEANSLTEELSFLKKEAAKARLAYNREKKPVDKQIKFKIYKELILALRQLAKEAPAADLAAKNSLPRSDVEGVWSRALKEFRNAADAFGRRLSTHPAFRRIDPVEVEQVVEKEKNMMLAQLETGSWLQTNAGEES